MVESGEGRVRAELAVWETDHTRWMVSQPRSVVGGVRDRGRGEGGTLFASPLFVRGNSILCTLHEITRIRRDFQFLNIHSRTSLIGTPRERGDLFVLSGNSY